MAQINLMDDQPEYPTYQPPRVSGAATGTGSGTSSYSVPHYQPSAGGFDIGETVRNSPALPQLPQTTQSPFNYTDFYNFASDLGGRYDGSLSAFQQQIFPQLAERFPGLQLFGSKNDKIRLPNGQTVDAVISAGLGGRGYNWGIEQGHGLGGYFSDPAMQQYMDFAMKAMGDLTGPQGMHPILADAIGKLNQVFSQGNPGLGDFQNIARRRLAQLETPLFATADGASPNTPDQMQNSALLRTKLTEPLEGQRAAAQQRALERASARGIGLGSGVLEQEAQTIDAGFDRSLSEGYRDLMLQEIAAQESREQEAVNIGQLLATLGRPDGMQLSAAGQLAGIGQNLNDQPFRNLMAAMGISQGVAQLPFQALGAAQSAFNTVDNANVPQQDPVTTLIAILSGLANQGEGAYQNAMNQEGGFWGSLFQAIPGLIGAFQGSGDPYGGDIYAEP